MPGPLGLRARRNLHTRPLGRLQSAPKPQEGRLRGTVGKASASEARGPGSEPRGWFNGRAGNRDPSRWLETAFGAVTHRTDRAGTVFPRATGRSSSKGPYYCILLLS